MTEQEKWDRLLAGIKWTIGALAVIAVFLLASPDANLPPLAKVAIGAFLAFAAYANPATLVRAVAPDLTARADAERAVRNVTPPVDTPIPIGADDV